MSLRRIKLGLCVAVAACVTAPAGADVLIAGAPGGGQAWLDDVVAQLLSTGNIPGAIDTFDIRLGTPTLGLLQSYDAVMVFTDFGAQNASLLGDRLADYVDSGGGVVQATFSWHNSIPVSGRWQSGGYSPLTYGTQAQGIELFIGTRHLPGHPVLDNVNTFSGGTSSYHNTVNVAAGGTAIADWTNGVPLVAEMTGFGGRIIGLNFYPPSSDARADFWRASTDGDLLMANALVYVPVPGTLGLLAFGALAVPRRRRRSS